MIFRIIVVLLIALLLGCSGNQQRSNGKQQAENASNQRLGSKSGLRIDNGINRGTNYTDSLGTDYNIRYIPITITNDSTIPIHVHIAFSTEYDYPITYCDEQFNLIPMPKEWGLNGVDITDRTINELPKYINKPSVSKTLEPDEEFVIAIGTCYRPTDWAVLPSELFLQSDSTNFQAFDSHLNLQESTNLRLSLGIQLDFYFSGNRNPLGCILIPCGKIAYINR